MWRWEDVKMSSCEDVRLWRWEDVKMRRCEDEKMWRWEDEQLWRCEDVKMIGLRGCEDVKMWRWAAVKMWGCEDERMWRCEDEKMWRCEDVKMGRCEDETMWRGEDVLQTPTIGRTLRSDALGKKGPAQTHPNLIIVFHHVPFKIASSYPSPQFSTLGLLQGGKYLKFQWLRESTAG